MAVFIMDILDVPEGIIAHQVSDSGVMGAGLALQIRNKYPQVYDAYRCAKLGLSDVQLVEINQDLYVANICGQHGTGGYGQRTNYAALDVALFQLNRRARDLNLNVYFPYGMGAGLGGGNWNRIESIIAQNMKVPYHMCIFPSQIAP